MKILVQRVTSANIKVNEQIKAKIQQGMLVFVGIEKQDEYANMDKMVRRLLCYRIFADSNNKMNLSVIDVSGGVLLVSQFTLVADTKSGTRPSFSIAKTPLEAEKLYDYFVRKMQNTYGNVVSGEFCTNMKVSLVNDGPVTFLLSC